MSVNPIREALGQALDEAFRQCGVAGMALTEDQRQILQQVTQTLFLRALGPQDLSGQDENPLDTLTEPQRLALLSYIAECNHNGQNWKTLLFSDWIQGRASGSVQFLRDRYGFDWINQIQPSHIAAYTKQNWDVLQIGDRIEVSSRLWEWIPEGQGEEPEWVACTVIRLSTTLNRDEAALSGTVQFENGLELEVQGLNDWNQSNWRPLK